MDFSPDKWLAPMNAETPHVDADVAKYIAPDFDQNAFNRMKPDNQHKLTVLVERLEFIDHLVSVVHLIEPQKKVTWTDTPLSGGLKRRTATYSCEINGHDFAGFDFDVDAIGLYLLLTCIDTVKGQPRHKTPFEWLAQQSLPHGDPPNWKDIENQYEDVYGVSRNFKNAFTVDCSPQLKEILVEDLAVVKLGQQCITPVSIKAWEKRDKVEKLAGIASQLYAIRSSFTHTSFRTFALGMPVDQSFASQDKVIVQRVDGRGLRNILTEVVRHLAVTLLIQ